MFVFLFRAFDGTIQTTPDSALNYNPVPQTPRLTESAIPISSVVGASRPQKSLLPNVVISWGDGSVVWHPLLN